MDKKNALRAGALAAGTTLMMLLMSSPALALTRDDGDDPGQGLSVIETVAQFVIAPTVIFLVIVGLVMVLTAPRTASRRPRPRRRPDTAGRRPDPDQGVSRPIPASVEGACLVVRTRICRMYDEAGALDAFPPPPRGRSHAGRSHAGWGAVRYRCTVGASQATSSSGASATAGGKRST